ncbi:hypothetical protein D7X12_16175 [Corallococcus sicarius]|uniref:Uncharacterized protein n=1 Tax=Corallococcus sicarius TaxID=2316726 RepID=A0A3A8NFY3_9BACT|nr:hypothetical protein D7X12_16175 [Corallococcus sicarius]
MLMVFPETVTVQFRVASIVTFCFRPSPSTVCSLSSSVTWALSVTVMVVPWLFHRLGAEPKACWMGWKTSGSKKALSAKSSEPE